MRSCACGLMVSAAMLGAVSAGCVSTPPLPEQGDGAEGLILLAHGSRDDPTVWADALAQRFDEALDDPDMWDVIAYDWADAADNRLRAARRGQRIGEELAAIITAERSYDAVQVIAHSAGAHVGDALISNLDGPTRQLTLLDPFGGLGLVSWGYGRRNFGEDADYADAYLNTDDGVPSTDDFPDNVHGFDVTELNPEADDEDAHWWPTDFYQDSLGSGVGLDLSLALGGEDRWHTYPAGENTTLAR